MLNFRDQSAGVIRERGGPLTAAVLVSQLTVLFLVLFSVRAAGIPAGKVQPGPGRDLVWRATTYFPPIFLGIVTYMLWRRGLDKGAYQGVLDVRRPSGPLRPYDRSFGK